MVAGLGKQFSKERLAFKPTEEEVQQLQSEMPIYVNPLPDMAGEDLWVRLATKAVGRVKPDSSPGYPYNLRFATNKLLLDRHRDQVISLVAWRLKMRSSLPVSYWESATPAAWLAAGLSDPVRPFLKQEPHPRRKAKDKKWRMICGVSVVDQCFERCIFTMFTDACKLNYPNLPVQLGIGFSDEMVTETQRQIAAKASSPDNVWSSDAPSWDAGVNPPMTASFAVAVEGKAHVRSERLRRALTSWYYTACWSLYVTPSGFIYLKLKPGQTLSGSFATSIWNGWMRRLLSIAVRVPWSLHAGDDTTDLPDFPGSELADRYAERGVVLRDLKQYSRDSFEFCSHRYEVVAGRCVAYLTSWRKAIYKLLSAKSPAPDAIRGVQYELRHNDPSIWSKVEDILDERSE